MSSAASVITADLTLGDARQRATRFLQEVSGPEAALDARIFLEEAAGLDRLGLLAGGDRALGAEATARLIDFLDQRAAGKPVWRVLGQREFWGLTFTITPAVLDPRPDTETIVAAALERLGGRRGEPLRVLDLGTGSGALLCALLSELPRATGWGVDRSEAAAQVASGNVRRLGLCDRAGVLVGDWGAPLRRASFDLVVSNPPYIESATIPTLAREVRDFDPPLALDGGADGLRCYRDIAADLPRLLAPAGEVVLEVGAGQAAAVSDLLAGAGLGRIDTRRDLGGHLRAVLGKRA